MDGYGPYPFTELPHEYDAAVQRYGKEFVEKNGLAARGAPQEIYNKLVEAFTQKAPYSRENIKLFSSVLAHYVADAHVPFHAALNHDGQLTGQWGLHSRFESELFDRYRLRLRVIPEAARAGRPSAREILFTTLTESFTFVRPVLDADKAAIGSVATRTTTSISKCFSGRSADTRSRLAASITAWACGDHCRLGEGWPARGAAHQTLPPKKVRRQ